METIICSCYQEITLTTHATCPQCKRQLLSSITLKANQRELERQIHQLNLESQAITLELYLRGLRRPLTEWRSIPPTEDFFVGVRKAPRGEKVGSLTQEATHAEAKRLLALV